MKLIEPGHQLRLRENMIYDKDFVICPKFVFKSLSKWYRCNKVIELSAHESKIGDAAMRQATRNLSIYSRGRNSNYSSSRPS